MIILAAFSLPFSAQAQPPSEPKVIHVVVALCDNEFQGIVPVPDKIGNGKDPANNLYWGCAHGVKTFFKRDKDWKLVFEQTDPAPNILERVVFKKNDTYLIADAYDGEYIAEATWDFLNFAAGHISDTSELKTLSITGGGAAGLICYVGHNGLMDFSFSEYPAQNTGEKRDIAIFACASKAYFADAIKEGGAYPLIWTTNLMSPEAYTLMALVNGWMAGDNPETIHKSVAQAYDKYQKCGIKGASRLFATGW